MSKKTYHVRLSLDNRLEKIAASHKRSIPKEIEAIVEERLAKTKKAKNHEQITIN